MKQNAKQRDNCSNEVLCSSCSFRNFCSLFIMLKSESIAVSAIRKSECFVAKRLDRA